MREQAQPSALFDTRRFAAQPSALRCDPRLRPHESAHADMLQLPFAAAAATARIEAAFDAICER